MRNAIILHGMPSKKEYYDPDAPSMSNAHWLPWLQAQLLKNDIAVATPEVPFAYEPKWGVWVKEVERYDINAETILVGHSCGAGFWVRYLSENKDLKVGQVVLVAPWIDVEQTDPNNFFSFTIDPDVVDRTTKMTIFHSTDDGEEMQSSVKKLRNEIKNVNYVEFQNKGHFTHRTMPTDKFPELLKYLI